MKKIDFDFRADFEKAFIDDDGRMHVIAVASDTGEDRTGDRMSVAAVNKMVDSARKGIDLLDGHKATFGFGKSVDAMAPRTKHKINSEIKTVREFQVDFILNERFPQSELLFNEIRRRKTAKQLSIGGKINLENKDAIKYEHKKDGTIVRVINDIELDHVAVTRPGRAANPRTRFDTAIFKAIDGYEGDIPSREELVESVKENQGDNVMPDTKKEKSTTTSDKKDEVVEDKVVKEKDSDLDERTKKGIGILQKIADLFSGKEELPEEVLDLKKAFDALKSNDEVLKDKNLADRISSMVNSFMGYVGPTKTKSDESDESEEDKKKQVDLEILRDKVKDTARNLAELASNLGIGVGDLVKPPKPTEETSKSLELDLNEFGDKWAEKISSVLKEQVVDLKEAVGNLSKGTSEAVAAIDERLSDVEKTSVGSKSINGQEKVSTKKTTPSEWGIFEPRFFNMIKGQARK